MGVFPRVDRPSPAFIHVDVDDLWAIAECYGLQAAHEWAHHVSSDSLPRFATLFREHNIKATFFVVGRDLKHSPYVELLTSLLMQGHAIANHSYSHSLRFRALSTAEMTEEISTTHRLAEDKLGVKPCGFRAPGYGWSRQLLTVLDQQGYSYDASLMPGPYGGIFRWMDSRLTNSPALRHSPAGSDTFSPATVAVKKTQYPRLSDTWNSLYPVPVTGTNLVEIPSATSGLLRLPFQAGVCMRMGWPYFRACLEPFRRVPALPFVFLFHAVDLADFSGIPYPLFQNSSFFNKPVQQRYELAARFVASINQSRPVITTEQWLSNSAASP